MSDSLRLSRRLVKTTVARTLGAFLRADKFLVVGYHRVVQDFDTEAALTMPANLVSTSMLERHLDWIGRDHEFVSLDDLGERLAAGTPIRRPLAAVTFDDGYRDVYENAIPMLRRKGIPAACFLVADLLGTQELQAHDRVHELMRRGVVKWQQPAATLRRRSKPPRCPRSRVLDSRDAQSVPPDPRAADPPLQSQPRSRHRVPGRRARIDGHDAGGVSADDLGDGCGYDRAGFVVGSHTRRHVLLSNESRPQVHDEVVDSKRMLETRLGIQSRIWRPGWLVQLHGDQSRADGGLPVCVYGLRASRSPESSDDDPAASPLGALRR